MDAKLIVKLVPEELRNGYTFSRYGVITSLGKFEGERVETLYYYDQYLNGGEDIFEVSEEERAAFDISKESRFVYLAESNNGLVSLEFYETREEAEERAEEELEGNEFEDESEELLENPSCPACDGIGIPLGNLGSMAYFRCQDCGMTFSA